jgi:hypothetical protein
MTKIATAPAAADAPDSAKPPVTETEAGTSAPEAETPAPASDTKDAQIAALQAQLAAAQAQGALSEMKAAQAPVAPATFSAPSAPMVTKYDSMTQLPQQLPQKLWDGMSEEDQQRFTPYTEEAPKALATV